MPHETGHTGTTAIPAVQLPTGVVPSPQSGTSQDVLDLAKKQAANPALPQGTAINPLAQNVGARKRHVLEALAAPIRRADRRFGRGGADYYPCRHCARRASV